MRRVVAAILADAFAPRLRALAGQLARTGVERIAVIGPTSASVFAGMPVATLPATRPLVTALGWALRASCDGVLLVDASATTAADLDAMLRAFARRPVPAVATRHEDTLGLPALVGVRLFGRLAAADPSVVLATTPGVVVVPGIEIARATAPALEEPKDLAQLAEQRASLSNARAPQTPHHA